MTRPLGHTEQLAAPLSGRDYSVVPAPFYASVNGCAQAHVIAFVPTTEASQLELFAPIRPSVTTEPIRSTAPTSFSKPSVVLAVA